MISIEISDETIMERMSGRRVCKSLGGQLPHGSCAPQQEGVCDKCGGKLVQRKDDAPETVKARLEVYHKETEPLKDFYAQRGLLKPVENQPSVEETSQAILRVLRESHCVRISIMYIEGGYYSMLKTVGVGKSHFADYVKSISSPDIEMEQITPHVYSFPGIRGCDPSMVLTSQGAVFIDTAQWITQLEQMIDFCQGEMRRCQSM